MKKLLPIAVTLVAALAFGQDFPKSDISFERLFSPPYIAGRSPVGVELSKDGKSVTFLWNQTGARRRELYSMLLPDGKPVQITDCTKIPKMPRQDDERKDREKVDEDKYDSGPGAGTWSPDGKDILFTYRGDIFVVPPDGSKPPRRLIMSAERESDAQYSPDGKYISFMKNGNVWLLDRATNEIRQLTTVSKAQTRVDGYVWSPTSKNLLVYWGTSEFEKRITITDYTTEFVETRTVNRGYVGINPDRQKIGVISVDGGLIKYIEGLPEQDWNYGADWSPDGTMLAISDMHADFKGWTLRVCDITAAKPRAAAIIDESTKVRYMNDWRPVRWARDGKRIYFGSDRDGWRHIWVTTWLGATPQQVTKGEFDVLGFERPKESDVLFYSSGEIDPQQTDIFALWPDGTKKRMSVLDGANTQAVSEKGNTAIVSSSDWRTPWEIYYVDPANPKPRRLTTSPLPEFAKVKMTKPEEVTFTCKTDGKTIHALIYKPANVEPGKKCPAFLSSIYADSAKLGWPGFFDQFAANVLGMIVMKVDFRASWGYGTEFETGYYNSIGVIDADEAVNAAEYLRTLPYVDGDHLGIWGWSYGGFLTEMVMFTKPDVFQVGVAVAPVTDWKNYNNWYTRHRLDLPKDNKENYKKDSPISHASGLKGKLLMIHGMQDDNVLFQETVKMVQALIEAGKEFDVMFYPRDDHSIGREESSVHVHRRILKYLWYWLGGLGSR